MKETQIQFREASLDDLGRLLEWRNEFESRKNSINSELVSRDTHERWLKDCLTSSHRKLFIAMSQGEEVGTVRFDKTQNYWGLSWTVAPRARGKGIGKTMVKEATQLVTFSLAARIKQGNIASLKIAAHAGFIETERIGDLVCFQLIR